MQVGVLVMGNTDDTHDYIEKLHTVYLKLYKPKL